MLNQSPPANPSIIQRHPRLVDAINASARAHLLPFVVKCDGRYTPSASRFHSFLAKKLELVESGQIRRLIVSVPPRHGKSRLTSVELPAWMLGRNPTAKIILCSYSTGLASYHARECRDRVRANEHYRELFPSTQVARDKSSTGDWATTAGGGFLAAGVGSMITGRGADLIIVDDPVKDHSEAHSPTVRENLWNWYLSTLYTRLAPGGRIVVIMCMTGDTPVRMADGSEKPLAEIRIGDRVATYDRGRLASSLVMNHASQGRDNVFRITTTSGKVVHANARHPFLVEEQGELRWIRLSHLNTTHRIVTARGSGVSGRASHAQSDSAESRPCAEDSALPIMPSRSGPTDTVPLAPTRNPCGSDGLNTGTGSLPPSSTPCCSLKMGSALSANNLPETMSGHIGVANCALTTITPPGQSADFSATIATSPSVMPSPRLLPSQWSTTSDFTTEAISSIEPAGVAEVFDVQIAGTENFIANGLVSHNTRWHVDDLVGRLLNPEHEERIRDAGGEFLPWEVINLPGIAETPEDGEGPDPIGREPGQALFPERFPVPVLLASMATLGSYLASALYRGKPKPKGGNYVSRDQFIIVPPDAVPRDRTQMRFWDGATDEKTRSDFTAGARGLMDSQGNFWVVDITAGQWLWPTARARIVDLATREKIILGYEAQGGFKTAAANLREALPADVLLREVGVHKDKLTRALPWIALAGNRKMFLVKGPWNEAFLKEAELYPNGEHDDRWDAVSGLHGLLRTRAVLLA